MGGRRRVVDVEPGRKARPIWQGPVDQLIVLASVAAAISLAYLLFILMSGGLAAPIIAGSALEAVARNVDLARQAFLWALWIALVVASIRHYRAEATGYAIGLAGVVCWLLLPMLVRSRVPASSSARELVDLAYVLVESFQTSGAALMVIGFLRVVIGRVILMSTAPRTGAVRRAPGFNSAMAGMLDDGAARQSLMRKCWELHFCRGSLRVNCPRYLEQRACWKARSGCYCDSGLATRLLDTVGGKVKAQVAEEMQSVRSFTQDRQTKRPAPVRAKAKKKRWKPPCADCPIYLDHQKFKYRVLSWLAYPAAAAIIGILIGPLRDGYDYLDSYLSRMFSAPLPAIPYAQPLQQAQWISAENTLIVLAGVLVAAVILQVTELAIFRLKL